MMERKRLDDSTIRITHLLRLTHPWNGQTTSFCLMMLHGRSTVARTRWCGPDRSAPKDVGSSCMLSRKEQTKRKDRMCPLVERIILIGYLALGVLSPFVLLIRFPKRWRAFVGGNEEEHHTAERVLRWQAALWCGGALFGTVQSLHYGAWGYATLCAVVCLIGLGGLGYGMMKNLAWHHHHPEADDSSW